MNAHPLASVIIPCCDHGAYLRNSRIPHPAWMFRKNALAAAGGYAPDYTPADDHAKLAAPIAPPGVRFANLPKILIRYRLHLDKARTRYREVQKRNAARVRATLIRRLAPDASENDLACHTLLCRYDEKGTTFGLARCREWLKRLLAAGDATKEYDREIFRDFRLKRWWELCGRSMHFGTLFNISTDNDLQEERRFDLLRPMPLQVEHWPQRKLLPSKWRSKNIYRRELR